MSLKDPKKLVKQCPAKYNVPKLDALSTQTLCHMHVTECMKKHAGKFAQPPLYTRAENKWFKKAKSTARNICAQAAAKARGGF